MRKVCLSIITFILVLSFSTLSLCYDSSSSYIWSYDYLTTIETSESSISNSSDIEDNNSLNLESGSAILIEQTTGQVLYSHNSHEKLRPASVTKVMSILLIMEQIDSGKLSYSDQIACSENARSMGRFTNMA